MSGTYFKPESLGETLRLSAENPDAVFIAGGTGLFVSAPRSRKDRSFISVGAILPRGLATDGETLSLGAATTFQEILESALAPRALKAAAATMATRNVRNRATVGGNIGADKSCASLLPFFLVSEARLACADGIERSIDEWRALPTGASPARLLLSMRWKASVKRATTCARYSRTAADLSILTCAVSAELGEDLRPRRLRIALGGLAPRARRFPELEAELEAALAGKTGSLTADSRATIESLSAPHFHPIDDVRGGADFKRVRAAVLLADAISDLEVQA
jgi:putative selenate reductase FAD-binding subunit